MGGIERVARTQHSHLWALVHAERAALAEDLAGLGADPAVTSPSNHSLNLFGWM
jgi:hypothetical protein